VSGYAKLITFFDQEALVACDGKCHKAWGINGGRPRHQFSDDPADYVYFPDLMVPIAPEDPGTYEGNDGKPIDSAKLNKWCVRECERSAMSRAGESRKLLELPDFDQPRPNIGTRARPTIQWWLTQAIKK
jgi:hypothetical protein